MSLGMRDTESLTSEANHDTPTAVSPLPGVADLLTPEEVAAALGVTPKTLTNYRTRGTGPDFIRIGGKVYYTRAAYDAYWRTLTGGAA